MKSYNGFTATERMNAFRWLKLEIAAGRKPKSPTSCDVCGQSEGSLMWHSEDYSFPYGKHIGHYGLCYICHMMIHCRFNNPLKWDEYKSKITEGFKYEAYKGNNWVGFRQDFLVGDYIHRDYSSAPYAQSDVFNKIEGFQKNTLKMEKVGNRTSGERHVG